MLDMERNSHIKEDIETMEQKIMSFLDADVFTKIDRTDKGLSETNNFMHNMNVFVKEHERKFEYELTEPNRLSPDEEEAQGITTKFGVQFEADGRLRLLTKRQICRLIMQSNELLGTFTDELKGI